MDEPRVKRTKRIWRRLRGLPPLFLALFLAATPAYALLNTYHEPFDNRQEDATIDGVDSWHVTSGSPASVMPMSGSTSSGSGKSLKILGAAASVDVSRAGDYGNLTPTWIEYVIRPGLGREPRAVPPSGIGAICFNLDGKILASDGGTWVETGMTFSPDKWYRVIQKLNFTDHLYDVYISPADSPKSPFLPDKENLHFTSPATGQLSRVGVKGSYNTQGSDSTYIDDLVVHTIEKIQFTSTQQTIVDGYPSAPMTVQLQNVNGEAQTAWEDVVLELKSTSINGQFSVQKEPWQSITQIVLPQGAQGVEFYYRDTTVAKPIITVREISPERGWTDGIQEASVVGVGQFFQVSATSPQVAGRPFVVEIDAKDATGQTDPFYGGTVDLFATYVAPDGGTRILTPETAGPFVQGRANATLLYGDAGTIAITVRDQNDPSKLGASANITFVPDHFEVSADKDQKTAKPFPLLVRAIGADGLVTPNYRGPAHLTVEPVKGQAGLMAPSELAAEFISGQAQPNASYDSWGTVKILASDAAIVESKGASDEVRFLPSKIKVEARPPSVSRTFFYRGESVNLDIQVLDANDKPIANFEGPVRIKADKELEGLLPEAVFTAADKGKKSVQFTASTPGTFNIMATEPGSNLSGETGAFDVIEATVVVVSKAAPVGTTELELHLVDSKGRRISDSAAAITLVFEEEFADGSIFISEPGKPVLFDKGIARVVIGNAQAETVTIGALSDMGFKIKKGVVTFGRVGSGGMGTLMLRESKDEDS